MLESVKSLEILESVKDFGILEISGVFSLETKNSKYILASVLRPFN
jgi:hypothetical protein